MNPYSQIICLATFFNFLNEVKFDPINRRSLMKNIHHIVRSPVFLMALTVFIDFTGFGLVIPLLPFWAEHLGATALVIGLLSTSFALVQFVFTPMLGALSDRVGRKPIIMGSLLIEALSFALTALAGSLPLLFVARAIGGLGASNLGSAQAVVADVTSRKERARSMGMIGAAIGLGFVVGPALGGLLAPLGPALPFLVAMGVALLNVILVWAFLPETRIRHADRTSSTSHVVFGGWSKAFRNAQVARLVLINLLYTVAFTGMETVFALFTLHTFGWTAMQNGLLFTYIGVIVIVMQGGLVGRLVKWIGEQRLLIVGLLLLAVGLVLVPWSTTLAMLLITLGILSAGDGAVTPIVSTLLSFVSPPDAHGETLGFAQGMAGLGRILGPLAAGSLFTLGIRLPFLLGGILAIAGVLLALPLLREKNLVSQASTREAEAGATVEREEARV
jgi:MFS transporter, DHA1 family, tetracycline resistance protein